MSTQPDVEVKYDAAETATRSKAERWLDIAMLYASKTGAIVVGLLILPQFNRLLGADQFGVVALILTFQSLLMVLDLGMSTMVGRDIAALGRQCAQARKAWKLAETIICILYAVLTPVALIAWQYFQLPLSVIELLCMMLLFWALTMQNLGQSALIASHRIVDAGCLQLLGVSIRGVATWLALLWLDASLTVFLVSQAVCAVLHFVATHIRCNSMLPPPIAGKAPAEVWLKACLDYAAKGRSLMLAGVAGAAVLQLDKALISSLASPAALTPYFLAGLLCLTPLTVLAGPIAQFFQPGIVRAISLNDKDAIARRLPPFVTTLTLVTLIPTMVLWLVREPIITAWLKAPEQVGLIAHYTSILLPGIAINALGYIPFALLMGRQDYRFQAVASGSLTTLTLLASTASLLCGSVEGVCWVYSIYFSLCTLVFWARCIHVERREHQRHSLLAASRVAVLASALCIPVLAAYFGVQSSAAFSQVQGKTRANH